MKAILKVLFVLLPMMANAQSVEIEGVYYNLISKGNIAEVTKSPNGYAGSITIPASITYSNETYNVTTVGDYAFASCTNLQYVYLPNSLKTINIGAFGGCYNLMSITLGDGLETIGVDAFSGCTRLKSVEIPISVTNIERYAFNGCSSLTSIVVPDGITTIKERAFSYCI